MGFIPRGDTTILLTFFFWLLKTGFLIKKQTNSASSDQ